MSHQVSPANLALMIHGLLQRIKTSMLTPRTALHLACACGHLGVATLLTERKCKLNLRDDEKRTPLMKAVQCQEEECVSLLLERGADLNKKDANGYTALHHAALGRSETIVAKLLQHQADMEARTKCGFTPLLLAINENRQNMVEFLIRNKANIHAVDDWKRTALMLAVKMKSSNIFRLLVEQGVDVFARDSDGFTVEQYASFPGLKVNHQPICDNQREKKHEESPPNSHRVVECSKNDAASSVSCKPGIDDSWSPSEDKDFNVDTKGQRHVLPVGSSNSSQSHGVGKEIVCGANYDIQKIDLRKIHKAAFKGNVPEVQRLLLLRPERLNSRDWRKRTALHLACACGHLGVATLLTERKCKLNLRDDEKRTPLMKAVQCQEEECVSLLLERGADLNKKDANGYTALHHAALGRSETIVAKLLQHQADMEARTKCGFTPLLLAINENRQNMVEFLIRNKANIHAVDDWKRTALMLAVKMKSSNIFRLLVEQGVDVFARDSDGFTVEQYASFPGLKVNHQPICDNQREKKHEESPPNSHRVEECSMNDSSSSLSWKPRSDGSWSTSDDGLFSVDTKEKGTKPAIAKNENGVDRIERAPQGQTNNDDLTCIDEAHQNDSSVKMSALGLGEEEDVESPWDSEPSIAVEHPDPNQAVGMNDVQTTSSDFAQEDGPPVTCSNDTGDIPVVWDFDDLRPSASHSMTKNLAASTEFGQTAFTDKPKTHIGDLSPALHLGMTSQEEAKRPDGNENNYTHVVQKQNDIQRALSQGQDDRILQDAILTNPLCKQKEEEINLKKMNSQVPENHEKDKDLWPENHMLLGEKERLKTETEFYHFMLAHPQIPFSGTGDECFRFFDKMRFDICNLKEINEIRFQKLLKAEIKCNTLENELHHTTDALIERTLVLDHVLKDQSQTQCPKEEIEHNYQTEQGKLNMYVGRLESLEERFSHLESEIMLLREQLDDAFLKSNNNEKTGNNIQEQLREITKVLQAQSEKQDHMMEERNRQVNELNHLNERIYQYEKDEVESNVVVLKRLQELCDAVRQLSMSVASLEVKPRYSINVEAETKDLKSLEKIRSQAQAASQENLDPPKQPNDGSVRLQLELRVKDLESELSKVKTSQESCKLEWKKYKYLYREELKARTSLEEKLKKAHERLRLANISAQHLVKEQQDTSLHTAHRRPDLEPPCVGNLNHRLPLSGDLAPREYSVIPSSAPQTTSHSMETCLFKVQQRLYNNITRELKEAAAEVESVSHLLESNTH
ncbi:uncharacterized protein RBU33_004958 [Hipposideros larvatus]